MKTACDPNIYFKEKTTPVPLDINCVKIIKSKLIHKRLGEDGKRKKNSLNEMKLPFKNQNFTLLK